MPQAPASDSPIPAPLKAELEGLRPMLSRQGIVTIHHGVNRKPAYRVRYRAFDPEKGCRIHRALPIGAHPQTVEAVRTMLAGWRQEAAREKEVLAQQLDQRQAERRKEQDWRRTLRNMVLLSRGGRGLSRADRVDADAFAKDPTAAVGLLMSSLLQTPAVRTSRRVGRPPKRRLW